MHIITKSLRVINYEQNGYLFILDGIISKRQKDLGLLMMKFLKHHLR